MTEVQNPIDAGSTSMRATPPVSRPTGRRPLIGITTSEVRREDAVQPIAESEPPRHEMAIGLPYLRAIERAGALPVVLPPLRLEAIGPLLDQLAGICLSGGPDISPRTYGATAGPHMGPTEPGLDGFELAIARLADIGGKPILAIGRGMQALNVVRGGTLHQHLPEISTEIEHRQTVPGDRPSHAIELEPASRLASILGATSIDVNSFHHQAIDQLGESLAAVGRAPDGTIEAIEARDRDFLVGVQWNAELLAGREAEAALFDSFVGACVAA
ncbi:MAG: putative glutamine amidotransferase [Solirubrobacterales bacterium]|jgi:putative glutamine amidotransferase|nr:putative glutamine amidotransferase [Solirubrobacterales bacterium]